MIHFNIILPSTPGLPNRLFPSGLPLKTLFKPLLSAIRIQQHKLWEAIPLGYIAGTGVLLQSWSHNLEPVMLFFPVCY